MTVQWSARPHLRRPALVAAFEGWNDAADAASDAVRRLCLLFDAEPFAEIGADDYFDFQAARPVTRIVDGVVTRLDWPRTRFLSAHVDGAPHDLVLLLGMEPNLRWPAFCHDILDVAHDCGCEVIVTLGALLAEIPHTRPVRVTGVTDDAVTMSRLELQGSRYEGPTGIVGAIHAECRKISLPSVSLWAPVPHYVATPPSPKATRALLDRTGALLCMPIDLSELDAASIAWETQVNVAASDDAEVAAYVRSLEERYDSEDSAPRGTGGYHDGPEGKGGTGIEKLSPDDLPTGDALAADFERYLREQTDET